MADRTGPYYRHPWPKLDEAVHQLELAATRYAVMERPRDALASAIQTALAAARRAEQAAHVSYKVLVAQDEEAPDA